MKKVNFTIACIIGLILGVSSLAKAGNPIIIQKEIIINAHINDVWEVLGPQFEDAYKWASVIKHSEARDQNSFNGSTCSERGCDVSGMGSIKERLTQYSETNHILAYEVYEGMPKMMKATKNTWKLIDLDNGKTKLIMKLEAKTGGFMGWMMKPMMKMKLKKMANKVVEEFKFYVENGKPHPRTIKAIG